MRVCLTENGRVSAPLHPAGGPAPRKKTRLSSSNPQRDLTYPLQPRRLFSQRGPSRFFYDTNKKDTFHLNSLTETCNTFLVFLRKRLVIGLIKMTLKVYKVRSTSDAPVYCSADGDRYEVGYLYPFSLLCVKSAVIIVELKRNRISNRLKPIKYLQK